jgi:hypothetical protein
MKTITFLTLNMMTFFGLAQSNNPAPYCASLYEENYNSIQNLTIDGNTVDFGPSGGLGVSNDYAYYDQTTFSDLTKRQTVNFEINFYSVNYTEPDYFALWIDFNQNDVFESSEIVMQNSNTIMNTLPEYGASSPTITFSFLVPESALPGTTRVRLSRGTNPDAPFGSYDAGFELDPCPAIAIFFMHGCSYDFNLNIENASSASINDNDRPKIKLYPNPVVDVLQLTSEISCNTLKIFDTTGKMVKQVYSNFNSIDLSELPKGVFLIEITLVDGTVLREKLMK